jgi:pimeloyl-ACP methyl ester carboxylesterase
MIMPYANNHGIRIHYQVEGAGPPLVLQHGFTDSLENWYERGYVAALKRDHQLILIDARGHGVSDKPHDPSAYAMQRHAADVVAVLEALAIPSAHFFGYSMGGEIGFALAKYAPASCTAFILGGASPRGNDRAFQDALLGILQQGTTALVSVWEQPGPISPALKARLQASDMAALTALWTMRIEENPRLEDALPTLRQPCLLLAGTQDGLCADIEACSKQIPRGTFVPVPGLDHLEGFLRSDQTLPHVTQFLATLPR